MFELTEATATVERLETIQGITRDTYTQTGAVRAMPLGELGTGYCGTWLTVRVGDIVFVIEEPGRALTVVGISNAPLELAPFAESFL